MIRKYSLETRKDFVRFLNPNGSDSSIVRGRIIRSHFGVGSLIRIPQNEFPDLLNIGDACSHINLPIQDGSLYEKVLLCQIIDTGTVDRDGTISSLPLLSFANALIAITTEYMPNVTQEKAKRSMQTNLISLHDSESIPAILTRRYKPVCNLTLEEALVTNVALRSFRIIDIVSSSSLDLLSGKIRNS